MNINDCEESVIQNLKDAGCGNDTIEAFITFLKNGQVINGLKLLSEHRRYLLDKLHKEQKQIYCLDYLIYKLKKETVHSK